ncbi:MAG: hypothetical protein QMD65_03675 [Patescibacteria group bacterium]|nr:hypothetical protein [Patescibacteria group bacterium]
MFRLALAGVYPAYSLLLCGGLGFGGQFCEQIKGLFEINFQPSTGKAAVRADGLMQNLISGQKIKIILAKTPSSKVQSFEEIKLWLKLGWVKIF